MSITLPLKEMTKLDKLRAMEALWDDLCRDADTVQSPAWHGDVLRARAQALRSGEEKVWDWGEAKKSIREAISS